MTPEIMQWLVYAAVAIGGYLLRHYHVNIPLLPQSPTAPTLPSVPAVSNDLAAVLKLLQSIQNPSVPGAPVQALNVSTPTHTVDVGVDGTKVTAK